MTGNRTPMIAMGHRVALTTFLNGRIWCVLLCLLFGSIPAQAQEPNLPLKGPKQSDSQYSGVVYGPITDQDTLWRIADRYRQNPSLSVYQIMVAIYELNPSAFEKNNLNLLVNGSMLKLPAERYVARIDAEKAKQRAASDDQAFARMVKQPGETLRNLKPPQPLVNQQDLDSTKRALEGKLNQLDEEQARQFEALRQQFALSMANLEQMLEENRKLFGRLDSVNEQLQTLRVQVESDVQQQIDQQTALQKQLLAMMEQEREARRMEEEAAWLNDNSISIIIIIVSALVTIGLVTGIVMWVLKRKSSPKKGVENTDKPAPTAPATEPSFAPAAAVATAPVAAAALAVDDAFDEIDDDELFNDDEILDDVLSTELEEALDSELESFSELEDDMLVPSDDNASFESGSGVLDQGDLDSLFDEEGIDADFGAEPESFDSIDLSDDADPIDEQIGVLDEFEDEDDQADEQDQEDLEQDESDDVLDSPIEESRPSISPVVAQQDKPEIDIDDLLGESDLDELSEGLDDDDSVELLDDIAFEKLDTALAQQSDQLDRMTDDLLAEIDQLEMMGALGEDFGDDVDDPLSDELLAELSQSDEENEQRIDALSDELLQELENEMDPFEPVETADDSVEVPPTADTATADTATAEPAVPGVLDDLPGLDDWLSEDDEEDNSNGADIDDFDNLEFDELLSAIEEDETRTQNDAEMATESNQDIDIDALLGDDDFDEKLAANIPPTTEDSGDDFIDVEALLDEAGHETELDEPPLNMNLGFDGTTSADDMLDIDDETGQSANLDLARVYLEMDDIDAAKELLAEVMQLGSAEQQQEARELLATLN